MVLLYKKIGISRSTCQHGVPTVLHDVDVSRTWIVRHILPPNINRSSFSHSSVNPKEISRFNIP